MSCWELAMLTTKGRITLDSAVEDWIPQALATERLEVLPLTSRIAVEAALLDTTFPADPVDRIIYSTARRHSATLLTKDRAIRGFDADGTLW